MIVKSAGVGTGSEFTLRLPAINKPDAAKPQRALGLPHRARLSSRILVVDDNIDKRLP